jgi:hypothetical protein
MIDLYAYRELAVDGRREALLLDPGWTEGNRPRAEEHGIDDQEPLAAADS